MEDIRSLFPEEKAPTTSPLKVILVILIVAGIGASVATIAFFGIGPMLAKPTIPQSSTKSKDVAQVLGLDSQQATSQMMQVERSQLETILGQVSQQASLPQENTVIGYILTEKTMPKDSFFQSAMASDVLIMFEPSKQVVIYRPLTNKVIQVGQLQ